MNEIPTNSVTPAVPPECIFRRFIRVSNADAPEQTYRVNDGSFARTRAPSTALEFTPDGGVVLGVPGPADARVPRLGRWTVTAEAELTLEWNESFPDTVIEIISCEDDLLKLRIRRGSLD